MRDDHLSRLHNPFRLFYSERKNGENAIHFHHLGSVEKIQINQVQAEMPNECCLGWHAFEREILLNMKIPESISISIY